MADPADRGEAEDSDSSISNADPAPADPDPTAPESEERPVSVDNSRLRPVLGIAAAVIIVDQITKAWASSVLDDRIIDLVWTLRFKLIHNSGAAFGMGSGLGRWLGLLVIVAAIAIVRYARKVPDRMALVLLGAILGGAVGNLIDRLFRAESGLMSGAVIDFIDLQWWPVFNIADIAVVLGALGLMLTVIREP